MIEDNPFAEMTGETILDAAERCISYGTPSAEYLKYEIKDLKRMLVPNKVYKLPKLLNSTKNWKQLIEEILPEYYAIESMRDLC